MIHHLLCMQTSFEIQLVWSQVRLLVLLELVDQVGLGLWGNWGPLKFAPQQKLHIQILRRIYCSIFQLLSWAALNIQGTQIESNMVHHERVFFLRDIFGDGEK